MNSLNEPDTVTDSILQRVERFKHLGSMLTAKGKLHYEIASRFKFKIHRSFVCPVAVNGSKCWSTTKDNEHRLARMKIKIAAMDQWRNTLGSYAK